MTKASLLVTAMAVLALSSCKNSPGIVTPPSGGSKSASSVIVLNEGSFGATEARISVYDPVAGVVSRDVVESANNGFHLGSVGDDFVLSDSSLYVVMSGSENVVVLRSSDYTVRSNAYFPGSTPHDILVDTLRNRLYVTKLYANSVLVLDRASLAVIDSIAVGYNPQGMALWGDRLYVCNSGYGASNTVSVIDPATDSLTSTLNVGDGPTGIVVDGTGKLWISCTGNAYGSTPTPGSIFVVDGVKGLVVDSLMFTDDLSGGIAIDPQGYVYVLGVSSGSYYGGPVHRISISTKEVARDFIAGTYYAIAVDAPTREIYLADVRNFTSDGVISIYRNDGSLRTTFAAEKGPGTIVIEH